jgi:mitogen-activated protein kinase kinase kinase ANP1
MRRDESAGMGGFHELFDSVRRSISFRAGDEAASASSSSFAAAAGGGGFRERIGSRLRRSRGMGLLGMSSKSPLPTPRLLPPPSPSPQPPVATANDRNDGASRVGGEGGKEDTPPPIRWRKGDLIGSGAFGQVYLGMNLDSGELIAVKQVRKLPPYLGFLGGMT